MTQQLQSETRVREFISRSHQHYIDGNWVSSVSGKSMDDMDPSTREVLTQVARGEA
ncbi:MAG: betaine-aldehyde dehydrogenase, partial [Sulfobacillus benefaciens]